MKMIVVAFALVALAVAAPPDAVPQIVRSEFEQNPAGGYQFSFETDNGINRQEIGELKEALDEENKPHTVVVARGSYSYPGEDGKPLTVSYYADDQGFHAEGDHIPKPARK